MNQYDDDPTILRGAGQVLAAIPEIDDLRDRVGQRDRLDTDLLLILSRHNSKHRRPVIVLLRVKGVLGAAVIFVERCVLGIGIGLLRAGDQAGDGTVIALPNEQKGALLVAMDVLLKRPGCHTVAASLRGAPADAETLFVETASVVESLSRTVRRHLPLSSSFEETLRQRFSLKKRKNLLYYRRSLAKAHDVEFVAKISMADIQQAIVELSRHSWPHRTETEIAHHCDFLGRHKESFCMGIRVKNGPWLSLITGWRLDRVTYMPWQLNHDDYKDESLMQVMRTYLLEHECSLGQSALHWVGGTVAFQTACEPELCLDILKARRGLKFTLMRNVVAPLLYKRNPDAFMGGSLMLLLPAETRGLPDGRLSPDS